MNKFMRSIGILLIGVGVNQIEARWNLYITVPEKIKYNFNVKFNLKKANKGEYTESKNIVLQSAGNEPVFIGNLDLIDMNSFYFGTTAEYKAYIYKKLKDNIAAEIKNNKTTHANDDLHVRINSVGGFAIGKWDSTMEWKPAIEQPAYQAGLINGTEWHLEINFHQTIKNDDGTKTVATKDSQLFLSKKEKKKSNFKWFGDIETMDKITLQGKWSEAKTWMSSVTGALNSTTIDITKEYLKAAKQIKNVEKETVVITVKHVQHVTGLGKMVGRGWDVTCEAMERLNKKGMKDLASKVVVEKLPYGGYKKLD